MEEISKTHNMKKNFTMCQLITSYHTVTGMTYQIVKKSKLKIQNSLSFNFLKESMNEQNLIEVKRKKE